MCSLAGSLQAQELPDDELQVNVSGYFDSFNVNVVYPSIALTRRVSETTSLTGRYLVDMITAASIRGNGTTGTTVVRGGEDDDRHERDSADKAGQVDAVTAASSRGGYYGGEGLALPSFDDVRHEVNVGVTQLIAGRTVSVNGIYSHEHDYSSATVAGTLVQSFARKNTTLQLGFVRSWDQVFPVTKDWTRDKNVVTFSASMSQIFGKRLIGQVLYSYTGNTGYLADGYQYITIGEDQYDPVHPDSRVRQATAARINYRLGAHAALQLGYRYYWDTWEVTSHTFSGMYQRHLGQGVTMGLGLRTYIQSRAFFFKPEYTAPETYMTVDNKLDAAYSNELEFKLTLDGGKGRDYLPFLSDNKVQYILGTNIYMRHTASPDWFSGSKNLLAGQFNIGIRYRF